MIVDESQNFNIPLDSPLDINKSDMLVNVRQPKFSFNRQKLLGGVLQTSVRYEDDGYFAGWWRHNFDLISIGDNSVRPNLYGLDDVEDLPQIIELEARNLVIHNRETSRGVPFYVLQERQTGLKFSFALEDWAYWSTGFPVTGLGFQRLNDTDIRIVGRTQKNVPFSLDVDIYTGEVKSTLPVAPTDESLLPTILFEDDSLHVIVSRILEPKNDWFIYRANSPLIISGNTLSYERREGVSIWGKGLSSSGEFMLTDDGVLTSIGEEFSIKEDYEVVDAGTLQEHVLATGMNNTEADLVATIEYDEVWTSLKYSDVEPLNEFIGNASSNTSMNKQTVATHATSGDGSYSAEIDIAHGLPIWYSYAIKGISMYVSNSSVDAFQITLDTAGCSHEVLLPSSTPAALPSSYVKWQVGHANKGDVITNWSDFGVTTYLINIPKNVHYVVAIRCISQSNDFIVPVDAACVTLSHEFYIDSEATATNLYRESSHYSVYDLNVLKDVEVSSYESKYHRMLNKLNYKQDMNLAKRNRFSSSDRISELYVPVCILGYAFYRIRPTQSPGLISSNAKAFEVITLTQLEASYPTCVRIDNKSSGYFNTNFVKPVLASVSTGNSLNEQIISVALESLDGSLPLYITNVPENAVDDDGNRIVSPGMYPVWTITGDRSPNAPSNFLATSEEVKPFYPSQSMGTVSHITGLVTISKKIVDVSFNTDYRRSLYNTNIFDRLEPSFYVTELYSGETTQTLKIYLDAGKGEYISFTFNVSTGFTTSVTTELFTYENSKNVMPAYDAQIQKLVVTLKSLEEFPLVFCPAFIHSVSGFTTPDLRILSQTRDAVELSHDYGQIDLALSNLHSSREVSFINVEDMSADEGIDVVYRLDEDCNLFVTTEIQSINDTSFRVDENGYIYVASENSDVEYDVDAEGDFYARSDVYTIAKESSLKFTSSRYYIAENNTASIRLIPQGIFQRKGDGIVSGPRNVSFNEDEEYWHVAFDLPGTNTGSEVEPNYLYDDHRTAHVDKETKLNLLYETKDIRDKSSPKSIYKNDLTGMRQFVKQFWSNDDDTENYWWISQDYVLEKTQDELVLWKKNVDEIDDWMGDKWSVYKHGPHQNFFGIEDIYYAVSNAKESYPVLYKLQASHNYSMNTGSIRVLYMSLDPTTLQHIDFSNPEGFWQSTNIDVITLPFGEALRIDQISAFIELNPASIISSSSISSTVVNDVFMLGFAYSRGLLQWTIRFQSSGAYDIVNGYGCVGLDGSLTGGQIPVFSSGPNGFSEVVYDVKDLESFEARHITNEPNVIASILPNRCYGSGSTVWFVYNQVSGIVSHYTWEDNRHVAQELSLTSNALRRYESSSFQANGLFDLVLPPLSFGNLMESLFDSKALRIIADILLPVLFYLDLKYVMLSYINHSFGQYAYTWRNSTKDHLPDGKTDQDIKFLVDKYTQTFEQSADRTSAWVSIILKSVEFADSQPTEYRANPAQNQTSTDDSKGRKFSQFFIDNVTDSIIDGLISTGFNISMKSTISQSYTLDMFYSISDNCQCFAGPGFVNHNFIGQCVAQAVTDTQLIGKRVGYWCTLKTLTEVVVAFKVAVFEAVQRILLSIADKWTGATVGSMPGPIINIGSVVGTALATAAGVMNALIVVNKQGLHVIGQLADAVGPSTGKAYNAGTLQPKTVGMSIEGTHTYGNKPMNFFWPAFGISKPVRYTNERVDAQGDSNEQDISFTGRVHEVFFNRTSGWSRGFSNEAFLKGKGRLPMKGKIKSVNIKCRGVSTEAIAPENMAVVEGAKSFLSPDLFKNEQIGVSPAVFAPPPIHDYMLDSQWLLGVTASDGEIIWVSCDDTKLVDGPPSNIVISPTFCGIASSYVAMEIKNLYDHAYLRPYAVTPQAIALNINKMNCVQDASVYHGFDGQGNRIVKWSGGSGMDKAVLYQQYQFQVNDHFKRSNILPPSQFFGIFEGPPSIAMRSLSPGERVANLIQSFAKREGLENDVPGEQKDLRRFSIPVHSDQLSTLPAMVRMLAPYKLHVVEGITSLCTDVRTTQTQYKAPNSIDFNIYAKPYRATDEFLCELNAQDGVVAVQDICATAGLTFIGATTREAFFFSPATRMYYSFSDGREIRKVDIMNRFLDLKEGRWDYVNQEVIFKALLSEDEMIVVRLDSDVLGEVFPPNKTIYSEESGYKLLSMAGGLVYQGPKRFIVNRFIILDYMIEDIVYYNRRKFSVIFPEEYDRKNWRRVSRDFYDQKRDYGWEYYDFLNYFDVVGNVLEDSIIAPSPWYAIHGWTHNPKGLVTTMLGIDDITDCKFEWSVTFAWTEQMDKIYKQNEYATVNMRAETVTQGGSVLSEVTRVFLFKECFTRSDNAGYYTFRFQSNNGTGNRERLYLWGDGITAIQDLRLACKDITSRRTQPLHTQVDVQDLTEL